MVLHSEVWSDRKVCLRGTGHAWGQHGSSELCNRSNRWVSDKSEIGPEPLLFSHGDDGLTDEVRKESRWTMMCGNDNVICSDQAEEKPGEVKICTREEE